MYNVCEIMKYRISKLHFGIKFIFFSIVLKYLYSCLPVVKKKTYLFDKIIYNYFNRKYL